MDKVIIDGVDVSGCEFSCENPLHEIKHSCNVRGYEKDNGLHIHLKCKNNPDCYFKQLQRLKEEKGGMQILIDNYIALTEKYHQTLQEIRKIARNEVETRMLFSDKKSFCDFNNILTKINEVIGVK